MFRAFSRYLREALTIDGVLEFKNEHFWTVSFGRLVRPEIADQIPHPFSGTHKKGVCSSPR